jgi:hypothetical protein
MFEKTSDEMRGSAEAGWIDLIANLERLPAGR